MQYFTSSQVISELNKIRQNPSSYSKKLLDLKQNFKDKILYLPNKKNGLITIEGPKTFIEASNFLLSQNSCFPLKINNNLNKAAQALSDQLSRIRDFNAISNVNRENILNRYGRIEGFFGETTDYGSDSIELLICTLLTDDGRIQRNNRKLLFDDKFNFIGVGVSTSKFHKNVTCIFYATNYIQDDNNSNTINNIIYNQDKLGKINITNKYISNLNDKIDLITDSAKLNGGNIYKIRHNYDETGSDCYNYNFKNGNKSHMKKHEEFPENCNKIEKNEKFIFENGIRKKIITTIQHMNNGETNTIIEKEIYN